MPGITSYTRNYHLDLTIPYEWQGIRHEYRPDYLFRMKNDEGQEIKIVLEVKGFETEQDRQKKVASKKVGKGNKSSRRIWLLEI